MSSNVKVTLVQKQAIGLHVGRQEYVRQAIVVYITDGNATAVVVVAIAKHVEVLAKR